MGTNITSTSQTLQVGKQGGVFFLIHLLMMVFSLVNLEQTFRASSGASRNKIKYIFLGTGTIFVLEIYRAGQVLLFQRLTAVYYPSTRPY